MQSPKAATPASRPGAFRRRVAWVFGLQFVVVIIISLMGVYDVAPALPVLAVIFCTTVLAWLAVRHEWRSVRRLARMVGRLDDHAPDPGSLRLEELSSQTDADVVALARGLQGFARRIADYNQRERSFTRDASHELRSPLTVIKMSVDMLADESGMSDFGARSVRRIRRASLEMEALVEAMLVLAREPDEHAEAEYFVVNDVLRAELASARELLSGRPVELQLEEPARFALSGSARGFAVLCWQLIRNACQQTEEGRVVVRIAPGQVTVSNLDRPVAAVSVGQGPQRVHGASRHGFELAIAQRISDRFDWPLELQTLGDRQNIARIHLARTLPVEVAAPVPTHARR
ncbi:MAG: HAMP domain-containing sensor histidine kinase [Rhodanobacter sp.]